MGGKRLYSECKKLKPLEIIVVANQSSDSTAIIAYEPEATIIEYDEKLGLDTGRAVGPPLFGDGRYIPIHRW